MTKPPPTSDDSAFRALLRRATKPADGIEPDIEERVRRVIEVAEARRSQIPPPVDAVVGRGLAEAVNMVTRIVLRRGRTRGGR